MVVLNSGVQSEKERWQLWRISRNNQTGLFIVLKLWRISRTNQIGLFIVLKLWRIS